MDESTMSPAERQFHELLEGTKTMYHAMGRAKGWNPGVDKCGLLARAPKVRQTQRSQPRQIQCDPRR